MPSVHSCALAITALAACGDNLHEEPLMGPLIELPLLASTDTSLPFNHSCEVTVASRNGVVAVASVNLQFPRADSFEGTPRRRVSINVSTDHGRTFGEGIAPSAAGETVDPVVTALSDGSFVLSTLSLEHHRHHRRHRR